LVNQAEIHRKSKSSVAEGRHEAVRQIGINIAELPDKEQAWADLHQLTKDEDRFVREGAARSLGQVFQHVPDKEQAWADLHRLTKDEFNNVRLNAAFLLCRVFPHAPDKEQAWADLHRLTKDEDCYVQEGAAKSLVQVFQHVPDREQTWTDLIRLTKGKFISVRLSAAPFLGQVFQHVPDKGQAWTDLIRLTKHEDSFVRVFANHSLGNASIFRATEAEREEGFRKELERALEFFERASTETTPFFKPSNFCLLFYRSFYTITFKKQESEAEVRRYLDAAKSLTRGSENKEKLLEAIENLADALKEVYAVRETDFDIMKRDLNAYRRYCDRAADLLGTTEGKAPRATKLIRRGLPIIDQRIKELLDGIDKETTILCDAAGGTEAEEFVNPTCKDIAELIKIRNPIELDKRIKGLIPNLRYLVKNLPERERDFGYDKIESLNNEEYLEDKLSLINEIIVFAIPHISMSEDLERVEKKLDDIMISLELGIREELTVTV
jgi:HEAT repeat protein